MQKISSFFVMLLVFLLGNPSLAQDGKAEKILEDFEAKFESLTDISGNFSYGISNPTYREAEVTKKGSFKLKKKNMYYVELDGQEIYCDGEKQWIYLKDDNEVNIIPYDPEEGVDIESLFELYKSSSRARYEGEETVHGASCHKIYLAFSDQSLDYNQAVFWINKKSNLLEKAATIDRRQTQTTYEFTDVKTNTGFADDMFRFNPARHPNVTVYDDTE